MKFFVYHHNDFDGIASGAIFAKFISIKEKMKFKDFKFYWVNYDIKNEWLNFKLKNPCVVIDFLYHPKSDWWFDHHNTTFQNNNSSRKQYTRTEKKFWDTKFPSCPSLLMAHFYKYFRKISLQLRKEYSDLVKWSDVIDGAKYSSPQEVYDYNNIYININRTLGINDEQKYFHKVLEAFFFNDLKLLTNTSEYKNALSIYKRKEKKAIKIIKKIIKVDKQIAFFDQSTYDIPLQRYLAYYLFPKILYGVAILKRGDQYTVIINYNNWIGKKNKINLGTLCNEYGGGGRFNVGAIMVNGHSDALSIAYDLKKRINSYVIRK